MTREQAFEIWAPDGSPWTAWARAVLFAYLPDELPNQIPAPVIPINPPPPLAAPRHTALLIELAGAQGIEAGLGLAAAGYRPVPLYNACPYAHGPFETWELSAITDRYEHGEVGLPALVDVVPILRAIADGTRFLETLAVPPSAPPAFLRSTCFSDRRAPA